ncbi:MAG TPA: NapC/NirT family cytochrome c [Steroidobacteraceae bacterium]|nr:NapC/NirT family cytochrome c [Steroidobacteraceae bacterium]
MSDENQKSNGVSRWQRLWRPSGKWYLLWLPYGGVIMFFAGIIIWGGFNTAVEQTSSLEFCISCHEMRDNVYQEYKKTIHYMNPAGVRAACPDCHVPHPWFFKMERKFQATYNELPKHLFGVIDTREKFIAHRRELAEDVWATMKATDSRECRNCHSMTAMDLENESRSARNKHQRVLSGELKMTCIDCHKGIAHTLPDDDPKPGATPAAAPESSESATSAAPPAT